MHLTNGSSSDADLLDFQRDVLDASRERPVVVDFWAPWCGPCQVLGPVLEKLAEEAAGDWDLVKINTDEHAELSQQAGIRGIPAVKLYIDGDLAAEFTGALPEPILRRWLDEHLPAEWKQLLEDARAHIRLGKRGLARQNLERLLEIDPENEEGRALLARLLALEDVARARELLRGLEHRAEFEAIADLERFMILTDDASRLPDGSPRDTYVAAANQIENGDFDQALGNLLDVLHQDRYYDDDGPRRAIVALFLLLGEGDPVVKKHRPAFNRSLY